LQVVSWDAANAVVGSTFSRLFCLHLEPFCASLHFRFV
jgi:hypothetical protein